jgi:glutathione S-transferase
LADGRFAQYDEEKEIKAEEEAKRWFQYLEGELEKGKGKWLAGTEKASLADLAVCGILYNGFWLYVDEEMRKGYPVLVGYYNRLVEEVKEAKEYYDLEGKWAVVRKQPGE